MAKIARSDNAAYFRERRRTFGRFDVEVERDDLEKLDAFLAEKGIKKRAWFKQLLYRELGIEK